MAANSAPIGIFDSGYGGLTVFKEIEKLLPQYDYMYLGDNARAPYGSRSFETVHLFTWQAVQWLFNKGCTLVILACNTASAKALRTIQQTDLPNSPFAQHKVLGVLRPTTEILGKYTQTNSVGILGTAGTVASNSYPIELAKFWPQLKVTQQACPMWVPLIENKEHLHPGADYFIRLYVDALMNSSKNIDTILLACTHYPLLLPRLQALTQQSVQFVSQGSIVANSLVDYLLRHPEVDEILTKGGQQSFYTTDDPISFSTMAESLFNKPLTAQHAALQ